MSTRRGQALDTPSGPDPQWIGDTHALAGRVRVAGPEFSRKDEAMKQRTIRERLIGAVFHQAHSIYGLTFHSCRFCGVNAHDTIDRGLWKYSSRHYACSECIVKRDPGLNTGATHHALNKIDGKEEAMPTSRECEECNEVHRCRMYMDDTNGTSSVPIYLCAPCARDHGFLPDPTRSVERTP